MQNETEKKEAVTGGPVMSLTITLEAPFFGPGTVTFAASGDGRDASDTYEVESFVRGLARIQNEIRSLGLALVLTTLGAAAEGGAR